MSRTDGDILRDFQKLDDSKAAEMAGGDSAVLEQKMSEMTDMLGKMTELLQEVVDSLEGIADKMDGMADDIVERLIQG